MIALFFPGMNLQICFMNETASDCESQCSDTESTQDREGDVERVSVTSSNSKASISPSAGLVLDLGYYSIGIHRLRLL